MFANQTELMTIADLIKDFIDTSKERLKTPISGAFLWSFIVYNWRPIFLLIFSNAAIEDKIVVINYEYCNFWAIFFPFFIALFYLLLVPKLMLNIDKSLVETKQERVDNNYNEKEHEMTRKINLARQDFLLKNVQSGSKEIDDLLTQIESLKETNSQITTANKNTIDQLNIALKKANDSLASFVLQDDNKIKSKKGIGEKVDSPFQFNAFFAFNNLTIDEKEGFKVVRNGEKTNIAKLSNSALSRYLEQDLIKLNGSGAYYVTDLGEAVYELITSQDDEIPKF